MERCELQQQVSGHVIALKIRNPHPVGDDGFPYNSASLCGDINASLLGLEHLRHLDLSVNCFNGTTIPSFIGSFKKLRKLQCLFIAWYGEEHLGDCKGKILRVWKIAQSPKSYGFLNQQSVRSDPYGVNRPFWFANPKSIGKSLNCGDILEKFGELKLLESLDFSRNELWAQFLHAWFG